MITITENAAKEVQRIKTADPANAQSNLRVKVIGGGCSGMSYKIDFDPEGATEKDKIFEEHGVKVVVDAKSYLFLKGTTLDFSGGLNGKGFVFNNPNASRSCGCGSSFSV